MLRLLPANLQCIRKLLRVCELFRFGRAGARLAFRRERDIRGREPRRAERLPDRRGDARGRECHVLAVAHTVGVGRGEPVVVGRAGREICKGGRDRLGTFTDARVAEDLRAVVAGIGADFKCVAGFDALRCYGARDRRIRLCHPARFAGVD